MPKIFKSLKLDYLLIALASLIVYWPSLGYGFAQDDFIHLSASQASNIGQVLNFFNPQAHFPDIFFYRPLTTQFWFFTNTKLFGLNPLPFHLEALILQAINSCMFYFVVKKIWKNDKIARLSGLFYAISAAHFLSLYYISAFQEVGRMFFLLVTIVMFLKYIEKKDRQFYVLSILSFILALLSKETSLILPLILMPIYLLYRHQASWRHSLKSLVKPLAGFVLVAGFFILTRLIGFQSIFGVGDYHLTTSPVEVVQNLKWYILWSFGLPESLASYPSLKPNSLLAFSHDLPMGGVVLALFGALVVILIFLVVKAVKKVNYQFSTLNLVIFIVALLPVLFLSGHRYPQYLDLAFLGVLPGLAWLVLQTKFKYLSYLAIMVFVVLQVKSLQLSQQSHWSTHRSEVAGYYHQQLTQKVSSGLYSSQIIFVGDSTELQNVSYALAKDYAVKVWFNCLIGEVKYLTPDQAKLVTGNSVIEQVTVY